MDYKLYFLNTEGRIRERVDLECTRDDHAVETAASLSDQRAMELWRGAKMIKRFPPTLGSAAAH